MSQQSLFWPLSITVVIVFVIILALARPDGTPQAAPLRQDDCVEGSANYPACFYQTTPLACDPSGSAYPACATQTAEAASGATNTATSAPSNNNSDESSNTTATSTTTPTSANDDDTDSPTPTSIAEDQDSEATPTRQREAATTTPTSTLPPDSDVLICVPDVPVFVEGRGPPSTALLLYFNERAVGGATSDAQGLYRLRLVVGDERGGDYPVEVQVRGTREVVDELICRVPGGTPTPSEEESE